MLMQLICLPVKVTGSGRVMMATSPLRLLGFQLGCSTWTRDVISTRPGSEAKRTLWAPNMTLTKAALHKEKENFSKKLMI